MRVCVCAKERREPAEPLCSFNKNSQPLQDNALFRTFTLLPTRAFLSTMAFLITQPEPMPMWG